MSGLKHVAALELPVYPLYYCLDRIFTFSVIVFTTYKMSLTSEEFDINELRAGLGKSIYRMKIVNFYYGDNHRTLELMEE